MPTHGGIPTDTDHPHIRYHTPPPTIAIYDRMHVSRFWHSVDQLISLFVTAKHTDASTYVQTMTTYEKQLYGLTGLYPRS